MLRSITLLALATALSLPSLAHAEPAPAHAAGGPALTPERPPADAGSADAPPRPGGPVSARAAIEAAIHAEIAAALADTVDVARYATLGQAVTATVTQEAKLTASNGKSFDELGISVSLSGDRALVGAPGDGGFDSGAAYVFVFDGSQPVGQQWSQESKLKASDATPFDAFGESVSLDGDRALVGAPRGRSAYVFTFSGTSWSQQAKLVPSGATSPSQVDGFGISVSLSGNRALIGDAEDDEGGSNAGAAYVFTFNGASWSQQAKLIAADAGSSDFSEFFGISVSLSGDRALVGAYWNAGAGTTAGAAYVFAFDGSAWTEQVKLTADDAAPFDEFGISVSLSGDRALVGAHHEDGASSDQTNSGSAYVFAFDGASWSQEAKLTAADPGDIDEFGGSVSLSGDRALVGADRDDDAGTNSGSAYLFTFDGASWSQQAKLTAANGAADDEFGVSVSLSGDRALVGAWKDDDGGENAGSAYVFDLGLGAPLVADAGPDQTVVAGQTVTLDGTGSVGAQTFTWTLGGAPVASTATPSFCAAAPATYTVTLTVSDGAGGSASDAVAVTAQSPSVALDGVIGGIAAATQLSRPQKGALVAELRKAQRALARGVDPSPFFGAFRAEVQSLQGQGVLTAGQASVLVGLVDAVAAAVASPCSVAGAPPVSAAAVAAPEGLSVWPNPSAGRVAVAFTVEAASAVRLSVVDALGREVAVLADGPVDAGAHRAELDGSSWPAGVYLVRLATADGRVESKQLTRLR